MIDESQCLQERLAPRNMCFGCGHANGRGLRIQSFARGSDPFGEVVMEWMPESHHEAFDQVLNGGIIGTLMDCHSNWTAVWHLMCREGLDKAVPCVTADFHVRMRRPTPSRQKVRVTARAVESEGKRVKVEATLTSDGVTTATCVGNFVAVGPGHPAYERW
jgi:acyl-coenzyme A thioesterase PaaI-like protein